MTLFMQDEEKREEGREEEHWKAVRSLAQNVVDMAFILKLGYAIEEYEAAISVQPGNEE